MSFFILRKRRVFIVLIVAILIAIGKNIFKKYSLIKKNIPSYSKDNNNNLLNSQDKIISDFKKAKKVLINNNNKKTEEEKEEKYFANLNMNEFITLNNGVKMPKIGLGVYDISRSMTKKCVLDAISLGYRSIDTAQYYGNEKEVGEAVRETKVPRNELFITTKLWGCRNYNDAKKSIETSLNRLNIGYIDLLLIHEPRGNFIEIYKALEEYYNEKKLKAIGISNFYENDYLKLLKNCNVVPQINQVETHVFFQQKDFKPFLEKHGTHMEAWSPLAAGRNNFFRNSVLSEIGKKYNKTVAQVGLRFLYQQDIIIIPKSSNKNRMEENKNITDFELSESDMEAIRALDTGKSLFGWY